ncbi:MAG: fimbrillin family protein [Edaphocola sp.]
MKKLVFVFIAVFAMLASCSKDDDSTPTPETSIVGKWEIYEQGLVGDTPTTVIPTCATNRDYVEFEASRAGSWGNYNAGCELSSSSFTWTLEGDELHYGTGDYEYFKILELTNTNLTIQWVENQTNVYYQKAE